MKNRWNCHRWFDKVDDDFSYSYSHCGMWVLLSIGVVSSSAQPHLKSIAVVWRHRPFIERLVWSRLGQFGKGCSSQI